MKKYQYHLVHQKIYLDKSDYNSDPVYLLTNTDKKKSEYVLNLVKDQPFAIKTMVNNMLKYLPDLVLTEEKPGEAELKFTDDGKIVAGLPSIDIHKIAVILAGISLYKIMNSNITEKIISKIVPVYTSIFLKNVTRSIDTSVLREEISWYLYAWFLNVIDSLTLSNFLMITEANDTIVPKDSINEIMKVARNGSEEVFKTICRTIGTEEVNLKQRITIRYGVDVLLGFEDIVHMFAMLVQASTFKLPSALYSTIPDKTKIYFQKETKYIL